MLLTSLVQLSPFLPHFVLPGTEWVDPEDPTVIAENELLGAAAAIEAAAKKLEQLKPRAKPKVSTAPPVFSALLMAECPHHQLPLTLHLSLQTLSLHCRRRMSH